MKYEKKKTKLIINNYQPNLMISSHKLSSAIEGYGQAFSPCLSNSTCKKSTSHGETEDSQMVPIDGKNCSICPLLWDPIWQPVPEVLGGFGEKMSSNFCILCRKITEIKKYEQIYWCEDPYARKHLAHSDCLVGEELTKFPLFKNKCTTHIGMINLPEQGDILGAPENLVELKIHHAVGNIKFLESTYIAKEIGASLFIPFDQEGQESLFAPRSLILPTRFLRMQLNIKRISSSLHPESSKILLDVQPDRNFECIQRLEAFTGNAMVQIGCQVLLSEQKKMSKIKDLNIKFPADWLPELELVQINHIKISFLHKKTAQIDPLSEKMKIQEILSKAKSHTGSKQYQKEFIAMNHQQRTVFLQNIQSEIPALIMDEYANYLIQLIYEESSLHQRMIILDSIAPSVIKLVSVKQGTFACQALINCMRDWQQFKLIYHVVKGNVQSFAYQQNCTHFLKKVCEILPEDLLSLLMGQILENFRELSCHRSAVCVMKAVLRRLAAGNDKKLSSEFLNLLFQNLEILINHEFGNYLVQEAYEVLSAKQMQAITRSIIQNLFSLCLMKYASIVVAKCISIYWFGRYDIFEQVEKNLSIKQTEQLEKDREGKKVMKQIFQSRDPAIMGLKSRHSLQPKPQKGKFNKSRRSGRKSQLYEAD